MLISPADWLKITAVAGRIRSRELKAIDTALMEHAKKGTAATQAAVETALNAWKAKEGANWPKSSRNVKFHAFDRLTAMLGGGDSDAAWARIPAHMRKDIKDLAGVTHNTLDTFLADREHARLGVVYLLGNMDVKADIFSVILEGGLNVAGNFLSVKQGAATSGAMVPGAMLLQAVNSAALETGGYIPPKPKPAAVAPPPLPPKPPGLPGAKPAPITSLGGMAGANALVRGAMDPVAQQQLMREKAQRMFENFIEKVGGSIKEALSSPDFYLNAGKAIANACVNILCKEIVGPLLSASQDLFKGLVNFSDGIADKVKHYISGRGVAIEPGHPETVVAGIKKAMDRGILEGFWQMMKGGASLGMTIATVGAATLVNVVVALFEMIVKLIWRLVELFKMKKVFSAAAEHWRNRNSPDALHKKPFAFHQWYRESALNLPPVSILTLNSGICGDKMQFLTMFDDTDVIDPTKFQAGVKHLDGLRPWGVDYLNKCGYVFTSKSELVTGLLGHVKSHTENKNAGQKVWAAIKKFANA